MNLLSTDLIKQVIKLAEVRLKGDWIIIGGALLAILNISNRPTFDIDLIGPQKNQMDEQLQILRLTEELNLALENINQAASLFLFRIPDWKSMLIELARGEDMVLYRPNATLFLMLKINRLSEVDYDDCLKFLDFAKKTNEKIDKNRILLAIKKRLSEDVIGGAEKRLKNLSKAIKKYS